jgi:hypothetical protein
MINRKAVAIFVLALASLVAFTDAHASEEDQATKLTFSQSVQIPGQILPAGTYWFVMQAPEIIQVFSSDRSKLYATFFAVHSESPKPVEKTTVTFADRGTMRPGAIVTWFYPGRADGHEFVYPKQDQREIAQSMRHTMEGN